MAASRSTTRTNKKGGSSTRTTSGSRASGNASRTRTATGSRGKTASRSRAMTTGTDGVTRRTASATGRGGRSASAFQGGGTRGATVIDKDGRARGITRQDGQTYYSGRGGNVKIMEKGKGKKVQSKAVAKRKASPRPLRKKS